MRDFGRFALRFAGVALAGALVGPAVGVLFPPNMAGAVSLAVGLATCCTAGLILLPAPNVCRRFAQVGLGMCLVCLSLTVGLRTCAYFSYGPHVHHADVYVREGTATLEVRDSGLQFAKSEGLAGQFHPCPNTSLSRPFLPLPQ